MDDAKRNKRKRVSTIAGIIAVTLLAVAAILGGLGVDKIPSAITTVSSVSLLIAAVSALPPIEDADDITKRQKVGALGWADLLSFLVAILCMTLASVLDVNGLYWVAIPFIAVSLVLKIREISIAKSA